MDRVSDQDEFERLRRRAIDCFHHNAFAEGEAAAAAARALRPDDVFAQLYHAMHLLDLNRRAEGIPALRQIAKLAAPDVVPMTSAVYLSRRRRTRQGFSFEDGWITMLEVVLAAGLAPIFSFDDLEARAQAGPSSAVNSSIPLSIVQFWDAVQPPEEVCELARRTQAANPDCSHQMFNAESARAFLHATLGARAAELFDACPHAAAKSDFFRVAYLFDQGGIYLDADEAAVRPLSRYIQRNAFDLVLRYTQAEVSCVDNCFIAVRPRMLLLQRVLDHILGNLESMVRHGMPTNVWVLTGPGVWTFSLVDLCLDPLASYRGNTLARTCLLEGADYQRLFDSPVMDYKLTPEGNWRMLKT